MKYKSEYQTKAELYTKIMKLEEALKAKDLQIQYYQNKMECLQS